MTRTHTSPPAGEAAPSTISPDWLIPARQESIATLSREHGRPLVAALQRVAKVDDISPIDRYIHLEDAAIESAITTGAPRIGLTAWLWENTVNDRPAILGEKLRQEKHSITPGNARVADQAFLNMVWKKLGDVAEGLSEEEIAGITAAVDAGIREKRDPVLPGTESKAKPRSGGKRSSVDEFFGIPLPKTAKDIRETAEAVSQRVGKQARSATKAAEQIQSLPKQLRDKTTALLGAAATTAMSTAKERAATARNKAETWVADHKTELFIGAVAVASLVALAATAKKKK